MLILCFNLFSQISGPQRITLFPILLRFLYIFTEKFSGLFTFILVKNKGCSSTEMKYQPTKILNAGNRQWSQRGESCWNHNKRSPTASSVCSFTIFGNCEYEGFQYIRFRYDWSENFTPAFRVNSNICATYHNVRRSTFGVTEWQASHRNGRGWIADHKGKRIA